MFLLKLAKQIHVFLDSPILTHWYHFHNRPKLFCGGYDHKDKEIHTQYVKHQQLDTNTNDNINARKIHGNKSTDLIMRVRGAHPESYCRSKMLASVSQSFKSPQMRSAWGVTWNFGRCLSTFVTSNGTWVIDYHASQPGCLPFGWGAWMGGRTTEMGRRYPQRVAALWYSLKQKK